MRRTSFSLLAGLLLSLALAPALAQNLVQSGEITLHYNAVPSTSLTPEVARQYGITRSANRVLVNVALRQGTPGADRAVPAAVSIAATNANGQRMNLRVREVREGEAIYYLAEANVVGRDILRFEIEATPEGDKPIRVEFRQEFFPD
ncbi:MAG TPA: DUF4426 domain-containing protein [Arenimonas sp.]|jgi:hypothetical protein|nr:DUF4426 domain-containing protein [Arenimonas sp.]